MTQRIDVKGSQRYPLFLGASIGELGGYLEERFGTRGHYLIITNTLVADYYADKLMGDLKQFRTELITVPDSEEEKSLNRISKLTEQALRCRADRDTMVLALGGGVIGDLAGFFASIFMRGIRYIHIPTTLLSQVDSSIGGKVAVNHPAGKNLLGAFYPPQAVWTDFSTLDTLPWDEIQNGLAETIKHALVSDPDLFDFIENHTGEIKCADREVMKELAIRSLSVKVKIVSEDEKEKGQRMLLNLGHSFGHALETDESYKGVTHGQGVSIGIVAAASLACSRGLITDMQLERIVNLLLKMELPITIEARDPQILLNYMAADKKNKAGSKVLVLPVGIGKSSVTSDCTDGEIIKAWEKVLK
ncbi:MAG: 3-dehydroquinate synthase [Candidatus Dichloromethanomonas elyunquensis]|nr:MAG: 3-dehydroquinate synthase [Candidatus Dichloromethanomonas elyunquensis]